MINIGVGRTVLTVGRLFPGVGAPLFDVGDHRSSVGRLI